MIENSALWHYIGSFTAYTCVAVGILYMAFLYMKQNPQLVQSLNQRASAPKASAQPHLLMTLLSGKKRIDSPVSSNSSDTLSVETSLSLEAYKTLYVIRSGSERFLIATSPEGTQLLSRLSESDAPEIPQSFSQEKSIEQQKSQTQEKEQSLSLFQSLAQKLQAPIMSEVKF